MEKEFEIKVKEVQHGVIKVRGETKAAAVRKAIDMIVVEGSEDWRQLDLELYIDSDRVI